ncbi:MAG TPA: hypothetical protein VHQ42_01945 [Candidatus Limnocylindria bacterium]|nr:hypothetical protein [Candidatus Limnocylindria bacterium]
MPAGQEFIKHEFDEAIAFQETVVETADILSRKHPVADAKKLLKGQLATDKRHLAALRKYGKAYGATGKREEVVEAMAGLAEETRAKAEQEESEAYEAHAVLLTLKRKQQDSADAVVKIARAEKNDELRDAAKEMKREIKAGADELAKSLADFAVRIATKG